VKVIALPRVTEILAAAGLAPDFGMVAPAVLEAARARGSAVHAAIEADHYGYATDLPPEGAPYLDAYRKFVAESGHEPLVSEFTVTHPAWQYVGHPDRVGWLCGKRVLLDWKCTDSIDLPYTGRQLTLYRLAWNTEHPTEPVDSIAALQLKGSATYRLHEIDHAEHEQVALAAVVLYQARQREGRL
jgi:hypothetical protein